MLGSPNKTVALFILVAAIALPTALAPTVLAYDGSVTPVIAQFTWPWEGWDPMGWAREHIVKPLGDAVGWFFDQLKNMVGSVFSGIAASIRSFFAGLGAGLWNAAQAPFSALGNAWASVQDFIDWLPAWAKPFAPLAIMGVVAAAGYMLWWLIRSIVPGI